MSLLAQVQKDKVNPDEIFADLVVAVRHNLPNHDLELLEKAYRYAASCHSTQKRQSGEPYITHPLNVALITASMRIDMASVIAAILHDVVEDTHGTLAEIEAQFGKPVAGIVEGLTKIAKIEFRSSQEKLAENFRKMVMAMAKDLRVILVKLADRLHNMRTIKALPTEKRQSIAQETLDIYSPLANRLGMYSVKSELEDHCLRQLKPEIYEEIKNKVQLKKKEREKQTEEVRHQLEKELYDYGFRNFEVTGRAKHFYSIFKKISGRNIPFEDLHDLFAFRIIVENVGDCYEALGVVHAKWRPVPGRFKDYIAMPKANMYQSLHTTIVRPQDGEPCEIQIRTRAMHEVCENGIAAHWSYKEKGSVVAGSNAELEKLRWLKQIVEWQVELKDPGEFLEALKVDLFEDEIFVFSPKGDVFQLPAGASALDFAFEVHSKVGEATIGAKINGTMVPIRKMLKSGDICEIQTSPRQRPSKDWLQFVTTTKAKNRIRAYLRQEQRERSRKMGTELLDQALESRHTTVEKLVKNSEMESLVKLSREANFDDLLSAIGFGKVNALDLVDKAFPVKKSAEEKPSEIPKELLQKSSQHKKSGKSQAQILVSGIDSVLVNFARCCNPLPGEEIVGFVTRGKGVTIHRQNCGRAIDADPKRKVDVAWTPQQKEHLTTDFLSQLRVTTLDRPGILADVTGVLSHLGANIIKAQVHVGRDLIGHHDFEIKVKGYEQLKQIVAKLEAIPQVLKVER